MARYTTSVRTTRPVDEVFAYMSDLRNFSEWDPGTKRVVQSQGDGPGLGARYDVTASGPGRDILLPYQVIEWNEGSLTARADTARLTSLDHITVRVDGDSTIVTYDADLQLKGWLAFADVGLRLAFKRIGDKAAAGLARTLEGTIIPS